MKTRTRKTVQEHGSREEEDFLFEFQDQVDLDALSEEDIESLLFEEEEEAPSKRLLNLPTAAGLTLILVGVAYIFQELGLWTAGFDLGALLAMLPWLAGILIILLGFGVLSWGTDKKKKKIAKKTKKKVSLQSDTGQKRVVVEKTTIAKEAPKASRAKRKRLVKSRDKKIAGVAGGIAEYFGLDPTLVRIAFVVGTVFSQGAFIVPYLLLWWFIMPNPTPLTTEERITIIRDS